MIRGVTFDWWHTIAETPGPDYDARIREIRIARVHEVLEAAGVATSADALYAAYDRHTDLLKQTWKTHADLTAEEQIDAFVDFAGIHLRDDGIVTAIADAFGGAIRAKPPILYPHISEILWRLRREGYRIGLVSNTGRTWGRILRILQDGFGIGTAFHVRVFSDEVRARKPDARIFEIAANTLGLAPREIVHVGDDVDADVAGAKDAGMRAVWFNTGLWPDAATDRADAEIHDHAELPEILARWRG